MSKRQQKAVEYRYGKMAMGGMSAAEPPRTEHERQRLALHEAAGRAHDAHEIFGLLIRVGRRPPKVVGAANDARGAEVDDRGENHRASIKNRYWDRYNHFCVR